MRFPAQIINLESSVIWPPCYLKYLFSMLMPTSKWPKKAMTISKSVSGYKHKYIICFKINSFSNNVILDFCLTLYLFILFFYSKTDGKTTIPTLFHSYFLTTTIHQPIKRGWSVKCRAEFASKAECRNITVILTTFHHWKTVCMILALRTWINSVNNKLDIS